MVLTHKQRKICSQRGFDFIKNHLRRKYGAVTKRSQKIYLVKEIYEVKTWKQIFEVFGISIVLLLYSGDIAKYGPLSKHFFQKTQQHSGCKSPESSDKLF